MQMSENRPEKGSLTVVSGFSGAGKGTIMKALLSRYEGYALSVCQPDDVPVCLAG